MEITISSDLVESNKTVRKGKPCFLKTKITISEIFSKIARGENIHYIATIYNLSKEDLVALINDFADSVDTSNLNPKEKGGWLPNLPIQEPLEPYKPTYPKPSKKDNPWDLPSPWGPGPWDSKNNIRCSCGWDSGIGSPSWMVIQNDIICPKCGEVVIFANRVIC